MYAINAVTNMPIIRPVATLDKNEIIEIAKQIDTYVFQFVHMKIAVRSLFQSTQRLIHRLKNVLNLNKTLILNH